MQHHLPSFHEIIDRAVDAHSRKQCQTTDSDSSPARGSLEHNGTGRGSPHSRKRRSTASCHKQISRIEAGQDKLEVSDSEKVGFWQQQQQPPVPNTDYCDTCNKLDSVPPERTVPQQESSILWQTNAALLGFVDGFAKSSLEISISPPRLGYSG